MRMKSVSYLVTRHWSPSSRFLPAKYGVFLCFVTSVIFLKSVQCCHPDNENFIRCFHVYDERDFTTVQSYLEQYNSLAARRVMLEGPTLDEICDKFKEMDRCMEEETQHGCFGFVDMEPLSRLLHAIRAISDYFCTGEKERLKAFLKHGGCILNFQSTLDQCQKKALNWPIFWNKIFRLEETRRLCKRLYSQRACVLKYLPGSSCDTTAVDVYNDTMTTWLDNWCNNGMDSGVLSADISTAGVSRAVVSTTCVLSALILVVLKTLTDSVVS